MVRKCRKPVFSKAVYIAVQINFACEAIYAATTIPQYMTLFALDQLFVTNLGLCD